MNNKKENKKKLLYRIRKHKHNWVDYILYAIIILSSILVGFETQLHIVDSFIFLIIDKIIVTFFIAEIILRLYAYINYEYHNSTKYNFLYLKAGIKVFFKDGLNIFDFILVFFTVLPYILQIDGEFQHAFIALRLLRVIRLLLIVSHFKRMRWLIDTTIQSVKSMHYVIFMLGILFYIYCILGTNIFGHLDSNRKANKELSNKVYFKDLYSSSITLFSCMTGSFDMYTSVKDLEVKKIIIEKEEPNKIMPYDDLLWFTVPAYYGSFFLFGGLITLNLFLGIIVNEVDAAKNKHNKKKNKIEILDHVEEIQKQLNLLQQKIKEVKNTN